MLTTPKRTTESLVKLGAANDPSAHGKVRKGPPPAQHRITRSVSDTPCPSRFSDETKAQWDIWVQTADWLAPSDLPALVYLCELIERRPTVENPTAVTALESLILRAMNALGLTPQARIQLGLAAVEAESKLEQFLNGANGNRRPMSSPLIHDEDDEVDDDSATDGDDA